MPKHVSPFAGLVTSLPLGQHSWIFGPYQVVVLVQDNPGKTVTVVVGLVNLREIREGIMHILSQFLWGYCARGEMCKLWSQNVVRGESLNPIMTGHRTGKIQSPEYALTYSWLTYTLVYLSTRIHLE